MKKIIGITAMCLAVCMATVAQDSASDGVLDGFGELRDLFNEHQADWIALALPGDATLFQDYGLVVPFRANKFPVDFRKGLVGEYTADGIPIFRITCVEDWESRQVVLYDTIHGTELWRLDADPFHDPYAFLRWTFNLSALDSLAGIDPLYLLWLDSAKIAADFTLVEEVFYADLVIAQEQQRRDEAAARLLVEPEVAPMRLPSVVASIETLADGTVLIQLEDPSGNALETYAAPAMMAMGAQSGGGMLDQDPADGLSDVWVREMAGGVIDPLDSDLDGDGINFQFEHDLGLNPNVANPGFFNITRNDTFTPPRPVLVLNDVQGVNYELDESVDLAAGNWLHIFPLNGNTNPAPYQILLPGSEPCAFYRIRPAGFQDSGDDLLNNFEEYLLGTSINLAESDGDGLSDVYEFINHLDPASAAGVDGALGDVDGDGFGNLEEQLLETDPFVSNSGGTTGAVATIRCYYDDDDHLVDFYCGAEVAGKTILTATHNIAEEVSAK